MSESNGSYVTATLVLTKAEVALIMRVRQLRNEQPGAVLLLQARPLRIFPLGKWEILEKSADSPVSLPDS